MWIQDSGTTLGGALILMVQAMEGLTFITLKVSAVMRELRLDRDASSLGHIGPF